jgi:hypothetical protein
MKSLSFSGHESFQCRNLWLKKGYEFTTTDGDFNDDLAVVELGVGKNMVSSIRFWMKAFGLVDEDDATKQIAQSILSDDGWDPFLEDIGSLWLLHYNLVTTDKASIYSLFFNFFRKQRVEFSKIHLMNFLVSECNLREENHSSNTIETDLGVLLKSYVRPNLKEGSKDVEDNYASLLIELDLIQPITDRKDWFECKNEFRTTLPWQIVLYAILIKLRSKDSTSVSFNHLLNDENSPGIVFCLDADSLLKHVQEITKNIPGAVYTEDAGIRELQFSKEIDPLEVLAGYYE